MKKKDLNRILYWIAQVLTCPLCESKYQSEDTRIIETRSEKGEDNAVTVHSDCPNCRSSVVFNVSMFGQEFFSIGVISDLTALDAIRFRQVRPVSADEVIGFHNFLQSFDGNFEKALKN